ncbi:MAG TPA: threonine ammonia-lyase [Candidatus Binataceae bacterium]|jgi:threonine dehydratase|nr:threonine ammonia-lyase [Candidatus Binataceae bacterium]
MSATIPESVTVEDLELARERLTGIVKPTPLIHSATLSQMLAAEVYLKPENLQKTGSFKIRGAYNRIATLAPAEAARGAVAASAGNHGQALAWAASRAGVSATIVMPTTAAIAKIDATRSYGPRVELAGIDYLEARRAAREICARTGALFVDAYDDPLVIAGQGTVGLEIADEFAPDFVLVPVGGGGLLAGIALALAARAPHAKLIGVEAAGSAQLSLSLGRGVPSTVPTAVDTIADGLATGRLGRLPFEIVRSRLDRVVTVDDFEIGEAVLLMLERMKLLTEGAGAAALAGALKLGGALAGRRVVIVVSGGNIDVNLLDRIIGHGLAKAGRLMRLTVEMRDRPGELARLLAVITEQGANVHAIQHDRTRRDVRIGGARVTLELETRGHEHIERLREALAANGHQVLVENP